GDETRQIKAPAGSERPAPDARAGAVASAEVEVEVTYLLNQIKADLGEQVNLTRTAEGRLRLEALVETEERKQEVLRVLAPFNNPAAIKIEVETVADALKRQKPSTGATAFREIEVVKEMIPADPDLRRYFAQQPGRGQSIDEQINQFANRM